MDNFDAYDTPVCDLIEAARNAMVVLDNYYQGMAPESPTAKNLRLAIEEVQRVRQDIIDYNAGEDL